MQTRKYSSGRALTLVVAQSSNRSSRVAYSLGLVLLSTSYASRLTRRAGEAVRSMADAARVLTPANALTARCSRPVSFPAVADDPLVARCCGQLHAQRHSVDGYESRCIECLLSRREPFFIGRTGMGHESWTACLAVTNNTNTSYWPLIRKYLAFKNGVPTASTSDAVDFGNCYAAAVNASDLMVRWGARVVKDLRVGGHSRASVKGLVKGGKCGGRWADTFLKSDILLAQSGHWPHRSFSEEVVQEPYRLDLNVTWLSALAGKTVLIVHPFNASITSQLARGGKAIWGEWADRLLPPSIRFKIVVPPVSFAGGDEFKGWRAALDALLRRVDAAGPFDVALLACGGLGMPLGAYLRDTGRSSIYIGGALQIWFGIVGNRWRGFQKKNSMLAKLMNNSNWVAPLPSERPPGYKTEESSAYW